MDKSKFIKLILAVVFLASLWLNFQHYVLRRSRLTVTGTYTSSASNETAQFNVYLQSKSPNKQDAVKALDENSSSVIAAVEAFDIAKGDIKSTSLNVYREQVWNPVTNVSEEKDWIASSTLEIKLKDAAKASEFAGILSSLEVMSFDGPYFAVDTNNLNEEELLQKAFADAKQKAQAMADLQGLKLGKVVSFVEGSYGDSVMPMYMDKSARPMGGGGGPISIEPGSSATGTSVTVTFELRRW